LFPIDPVLQRFVWVHASRETIVTSAAQVLKDDNLLRLTSSESAASRACHPSLAYVFFQPIFRYRVGCSGKKRGNSLYYSAYWMINSG
jgi:hypothetical protein